MMAVGIESESGTCADCVQRRLCPDDTPIAPGLTAPPSSSRLRSLVKADCCNLVSERCVARTDARCIVLAGGSCAYFERTLLPGAKHSGAARLLADVARDYARDAVADRAKLFHAERRCPDCRGPIAARKRFCDACAAKHQRESVRRHRAARRGVGVKELTENHPEIPAENRAFSGALPVSGSLVQTSRARP